MIKNCLLKHCLLCDNPNSSLDIVAGGWTRRLFIIVGKPTFTPTGDIYSISSVRAISVVHFVLKKLFHF